MVSLLGYTVISASGDWGYELFCSPYDVALAYLYWIANPASAIRLSISEKSIDSN